MSLLRADPAPSPSWALPDNPISRAAAIAYMLRHGFAGRILP